MKKRNKLVSLDENSLRIAKKMKNFSKWIRDSLKVYSDHMEGEEEWVFVIWANIQKRIVKSIVDAITLIGRKKNEKNVFY